MLLKSGLSILILHVFFAPSYSKHPNKPNIVFIMADDMGFQDVGFRGSDIITPNLDSLAREGVVLENHYVMPMCSPTRASFLSGRYAIRTGFWKGNIGPDEAWGLRLNETTIPDMLQRNGYETHGVGKWHAGMYTKQHTPAKRGFDSFFGLYLGSQHYFTHRRSGNMDLRSAHLDADGKLVDEMRYDLDGQYNTHLFTEKAVDIISDHDPNKPLFLYLSYTAPHGPLEAPPEDIERFTEHMQYSSKNRKTYATQISLMDEGIGQVVDALKETGLMKNTLLVFSSDNGAVFKNATGSNFPLRGGKMALFDGGVKALTFVNSPLLTQTGYVNTNLHHVTDWFATFRKLARDDPDRQKPDLPIDGVNIWPSISNNRACRDEILVNMRDESKVNDAHKPEFRAVKRSAFETECDAVQHEDDKLKDYFVLRWKNWKLFNGTFIFPGWTDENNLPHRHSVDEVPAAKSDKITGTLLFNLDEDPREERDVAYTNPEIVQFLLSKMPSYREKMTMINRRRPYKESGAGGEWNPWIRVPEMKKKFVE